MPRREAGGSERGGTGGGGDLSDDAEVRQASETFYAALNAMLNGDTGPMGETWSHADDVSTMHPLGGRQVGWNAVLESWQGAAQAFSGGSVEVTDRAIRVSGDLAYTLDTENLSAEIGEQPIAGQVRATDVYRREAGAWKIVHHHADVHVVLQQILGLV